MGLEERDGSAALVGSASISALSASQTGGSTWIKLELPYSGGGAGLGDRDDYQHIDRCCPPANINLWQTFVSKHLRSKGKSNIRMTARSWVFFFNIQLRNITLYNEVFLS